MARTVNLLAALRQLACLGLPGKAALPEALGLLRQLVGFDMETAHFMDQGYRLSDVYAPPYFPLADMHLYASHFYDSPGETEAVGWRWRELVRSGRRVVPVSERVGRAAVERTEFWDCLLRPYGTGWMCMLPLGAGPGARCVLILTRPFAQRDFGARDLHLLELAHPWLCHALAGVAVEEAQPLPAPEAETVETGILILDGAGRLVHSSDGALRLLHLAVGEPLTVHSLAPTVRGQVDALWRRLAAEVFAVAAGHGTQLPAGSVRNAHGFFRWRAYALDAHVPGTPAHVALHVERRLPLAAQLFRAPRFLALSARERDVALALAQGRSREEMSASLGLQPTSVAGYVRSLYRRLHVSQARDVAQALMR